MSFPSDRLYHGEHLWLYRDGPEEAVLGITDFAQESLGQIVYIEHPDPGGEVRRGVSFGTVESAKTASDLIAPASGTVVRGNDKLNDEPWLVNKDPYGDGWILRIRLTKPSELDALLSAEEYRVVTSGNEPP